MMRLALALLLLCTLPARADVTPEQDRAIVENTIVKYLRPGFAELETRAAGLQNAVETFCAAPDGAKLDEAKAAFVQLLDQWSRVEYARLGPVIEEKRLERFSFWPDPKGIGLRQVQAILSSKDADAVSVDTLKGKSVAVQGMQALEFVLYGTGADGLTSGDTFRCTYGEAIADNLASIATEISDAWSDDGGYVAVMREPGPDNPVYRDAREPVADIVEIVTTGLQFVRDVKLGNFVGDTPEKAKPRQAAFWRSGQTLPSIRANLEGLQELFDVSGMAETLSSQPTGGGYRSSINFEFRNAFRNLDAGYPPLEEAVVSPDDHDRLGYLSIVANSLWKYFNEAVAGVLGLRMGFNALDGD